MFCDLKEICSSDEFYVTIFWEIDVVIFDIVGMEVVYFSKIEISEVFGENSRINKEVWSLIAGLLEAL